MSAILKRRAIHLCALAVGGAVLVVADAGAYDARTDHKCVWNCGGPSTRTIIIEREVEIVHQLGPPQIVWKLPNVDGATQSSFGAVTDAGVRGELESQSVTAYMLYRKAVRTMQDSVDCAKAIDYLLAARQKEPSASELQDIEGELGRLKARFECAAAVQVRFHKTPDHSVALQIDGIPDKVFDRLFDPKRKDLEPLRQELLPLLMAKSEAKYKLEKLKSQKVKGEELKKAQGELKKAENEVKDKVVSNEKKIMNVVFQ